MIGRLPKIGYKAVKLGTAALEDEAIRLAREGVDKPVFYKGEHCGNVRRCSDTLLIFMLKARKPDVYCEPASIEHTEAMAGPMPCSFTCQPTGVAVSPLKGPKGSAGRCTLC